MGDREFGHAGNVLGHGREVDVGQAGQTAVVEADHRDLAGDRDTRAEEGVERAGGARVVEGQEGAGPGVVARRAVAAAAPSSAASPPGRTRMRSARP